MSEEVKKPDSLMVVNIELEFRAKESKAKDAPAIGFTSWSISLPSEEDTAELLDGISDAIREERLYGFMQQLAAEGPVSSGEWTAKTESDMQYGDSNHRMPSYVTRTRE